MTNRILQTDIDLAKKLLEAGRPDSEVVKALTYRKIDQPKAAQLVAALRAGQEVAPEIDVDVEANEAMKARRSSSGGGTQGASSTESTASHRPATTGQGGGKGWVVWLVIFLVLASVAAYFFMRSSTSSSDQVPAPEGAPEPGVSQPAAPDAAKQ